MGKKSYQVNNHGLLGTNELYDNPSGTKLNDKQESGSSGILDDMPLDNNRFEIYQCVNFSIENPTQYLPSPRNSNKKVTKVTTFKPGIYIYIYI